MEYLPCVELEPQVPATASIIWLHGLGANGHDFEPVAKELTPILKTAVRFIFPHAPQIPVTVNGGYVMPAWYDIFEMSLERKVDSVQLIHSADHIKRLIDREIERGIASERILLAGFSQGGAVVYHAALTESKPLGGLLILSSYFATADLVLNQATNRQMPILIQHGTQDQVVPSVLGNKAFEQLTAAGFKVAMQNYPMEHSVCAQQIVDIGHWINACLDNNS